MTWLRRHTLQRAAALLVVLAVLAIPVALSRHHHGLDGADAGRDGCAVCAATVHAPALVAPLTPPLGLVAVGAAPAQPVARVWQHACLGAHTTRGPPAVLHTLVA